MATDTPTRTVQVLLAAPEVSGGSRSSASLVQEQCSLLPFPAALLEAFEWSRRPSCCGVRGGGGVPS